MYVTIIKRMGSCIFHTITNTDIKHDFTSNLQKYISYTLKAIPIHHDMAASDNENFLNEPDDDDAPVLRVMPSEPEDETLPRRSDLPASSCDTTPQYYSPRATER